MKAKLVILSLLMSAGGTLGVGAAAQAGCNFHGCSQVPGVECNFHGCPIPPNGGECNFHGCPPPTQQQRPQQQQQGTVYVPVVIPGASHTSNEAPKATTQQVADCMKDLMFDQKYVCTDPDGKCGVFSSYWRLQNVTTGLSEDAAVRACTAGGR